MNDPKLLCMVLCTLAIGYRKAYDGGKCSADSLRQRMSSFARILREEHRAVRTALNDMAPVMKPDDLLDFTGRFALLWKVIDGHDKNAFKAGERQCLPLDQSPHLRSTASLAAVLQASGLLVVPLAAVSPAAGPAASYTLPTVAPHFACHCLARCLLLPHTLTTTAQHLSHRCPTPCLMLPYTSVAWLRLIQWPNRWQM
ncbi:hypothetical protein V8C86DRAFT_3033974 [Haematococcus lacustris]